MSHTPRKPKPLIQGEWRAHTRRHRRTTGIGDEWYWVARCRTGGMDRQVSLGWHITTRSARESLLKLVREQGPKPSSRARHKLVDLIDDFVHATRSSRGSRANRKLTPSATWNRRYGAEVVFKPWLETHYPNLRVNDFDEDHFVEYLAFLQATTSRLGSPYKPNTIQGLLRVVHALLYHCQHKGLRSVAIPSTPVVVRNGGQPLSPARVCDEDIKAVARELGKLDPRGPAFLEVLRATGCRPSEVLNLRRFSLKWKDEHGTRNHYLDIRSLPQFGYQVKTESSERQIPIPEKLWCRLLAMASEDDTPVFGSPMKSAYHYWQERLAQAAKSAGVPKPQFRDFRNTRSAELIAAGTPVNTYASLMGHSARIALTHYARATLAERADAMRLVPTPTYEEDLSD